jgi:hypothetical protein
MKKMLEYLREHRRDGVIVLIDDISRLARDIRAHLKLRDDIARVGARLESPTMQFSESRDLGPARSRRNSSGSSGRSINSSTASSRLRRPRCAKPTRLASESLKRRNLNSARRSRIAENRSAASMNQFEPPLMVADPFKIWHLEISHTSMLCSNWPSPASLPMCEIRDFEPPILPCHSRH